MSFPQNVVIWFRSSRVRHATVLVAVIAALWASSLFLFTYYPGYPFTQSLPEPLKGTFNMGSNCTCLSQYLTLEVDPVHGTLGLNYFGGTTSTLNWFWLIVPFTLSRPIVPFPAGVWHVENVSTPGYGAIIWLNWTQRGSQYPFSFLNQYFNIHQPLLIDNDGQYVLNLPCCTVLTPVQKDFSKLPGGPGLCSGCVDKTVTIDIPSFNTAPLETVPSNVTQTVSNSTRQIQFFFGKNLQQPITVVYDSFSEISFLRNLKFFAAVLAGVPVGVVGEEILRWADKRFRKRPPAHSDASPSPWWQLFE
jgi:hypothetical protein